MLCVCVCMCVNYKVTELPIYVVKKKKERYTFFLLVGHTYLNCRAVTQHQGPCGPGSPTWGRRGSGDKHLSGRFSTNVMLHGNHTCCASKTGQTGFGGPERKRTVVTVVRSPHSADDDEVEEEEKKNPSRAGITISSVHEKNSWILSSYSQFPIAVPPLLLSCINMYTTRHFFNLLSSRETLQKYILKK